MLRFAWIFVLLPLVLQSQQRQPGSSEIKLKLKKLNMLGSVLYVAAHPDDENTRVIAYLASERLAATAYLSMTRGDGGQNLIGPEFRDLLGLIRTQELLSARKIDGGEQFFARAIDFGYSKSETETFEIWNRDEILSDVVRVYREFQPDIIITRFPPDQRAGHGQHTASAVLAQEAFDAAALADRFPEQVRKWGAWQARRLFTNTGRWWNQTIDENTAGVVALNVGAYNSLLGKSYSEIAAESRTQHKSQGFGSPGRRGEALEFFELAKGDAPDKDIFDQVNISWSRVKGGERIAPLVQKAVEDFSEERPDLSVGALLRIRKGIAALEPGVWKERKLREVNQLVKDCLGLYAEVTADQFYAPPGERVRLEFEIVNRSGTPVILNAVRSRALGLDTVASTNLGLNQLVTFRSGKVISPSVSYSSPYWLQQEHTLGIFTVGDPERIGRPENPPAISIEMTFHVEGEDLVVSTPLVYKWTDPVRGESSRPFEIVPPVTANLASQVYVFSDQSPQQVQVTLRSFSGMSVKGSLRLDLPSGWRTDPAAINFELARRGSEKELVFTVTPTAAETTSSIRAVATFLGKEYDYSLQTIGYDHIPTQTLLPKAQAKAVRINLRKEGTVVSYIRGAGDEVPSALRHMGYEVWEMKNDEVTAENLKRVDAVVLGVRALNTNDRIRHFMPALLNFVEEGGTLVTQYNTNFDLEIEADKFSPYPLTLSRDRVTEENSKVTILKPEHPVMNYPNKIVLADFEGWVQERGLYFPGQWDSHYEAILSAGDKGEKPKEGALLVARYGNGFYVYTGLSFFRELPEGVPGAYKIFANLVSLGKTGKPQNQKARASRR